MKVICFGDSNTYGYDPRGYFVGLYEADSRWVDILAAETGWTAYNMGKNGREVPPAAPVFPAATDLLIVMLGNHELFQGVVLNRPLRDWSNSSQASLWTEARAC